MTDATSDCSTNAMKSDSESPDRKHPFGMVRASLEILVILVSSVVGITLGSLTGWLPLSPVLGMVFPLIFATGFLRREGSSWHDLGFRKKISWPRFVGYTFAALALTMAVNGLVIGPLLNAIDAPAADISLLVNAIEGNTTNFLAFLFLVVWGSAAFGEEMIARGFILDRVSKVFGIYIAIFVQAAIFGLAHSYQGPTGMLTIFVLALVFGMVYVRSGRNLWPVIVAHGIMDTIGITIIYLGYGDLITGG